MTWMCHLFSQQPADRSSNFAGIYCIVFCKSQNKFVFLMQYNLVLSECSLRSDHRTVHGEKHTGQWTFSYSGMFTLSHTRKEHKAGERGKGSDSQTAPNCWVDNRGEPACYIFIVRWKMAQQKARSLAVRTPGPDSGSNGTESSLGQSENVTHMPCHHLYHVKDWCVKDSIKHKGLSSTTAWNTGGSWLNIHIWLFHLHPSVILRFFFLFGSYPSVPTRLRFLAVVMCKATTSQWDLTCMLGHL